MQKAAPANVNWSIVPAAPEHIPSIAGNMRQADRREVWACHRHTPQEALESSLRRSEAAWTCLVHGRPAFMWGVARVGSLVSLVGAPWLLGTPDILTVRKEFLRQCPAYVDTMQKRFPRLENRVHAGNGISIRWLRWCGFTVENTPTRQNGEDFFLFWRDAHV